PTSRHSDCTTRLHGRHRHVQRSLDDPGPEHLGPGARGRTEQRDRGHAAVAHHSHRRFRAHALRQRGRKHLGVGHARGSAGGGGGGPGGGPSGSTATPWGGTASGTADVGPQANAGVFSYKDPSGKQTYGARADASTASASGQMDVPGGKVGGEVAGPSAGAGA